MQMQQWWSEAKRTYLEINPILPTHDCAFNAQYEIGTYKH